MLFKQQPSASVEAANQAAEHAVDLMSQQVWCWGRDIMRAEGNWLIEFGFERMAPPADRESCSSVYTITLPEGGTVVLRGFGVFHGAPELGGIFLPRFEFRPLYTVCPTLDSPLWSNTDLPNFSSPDCSQRSSCVSLTLNLIDWICGYEEEIVDRLGIEYRRTTLVKWNNGESPPIAAEKMVSAWRELSHQVATDSLSLF